MDEAKYVAGDIIASKYRLAEILGEGGMGSVWRARNLTLEVDVAVKLLRRECASGRAWEQLLQEARTTARLGHDGIVRVFDFGETDRGDPFLVMEHLTGPLLADVLDERPMLPPMDAVRLLLPVAGALAAAHAKGIVHCDIKPENVVLAAAAAGTICPKLIDFGISKLHFGGAASGEAAGALVGTPGYMSPEQAAGRHDVDPRSDIWSFCVMLYEVLAGRRPWGDKAGQALIDAMRGGEPPSTLSLGVGDRELWAIVARGLRANPSSRWTSMREFGQELAAWALERGEDTDVTGTSLMVQWFEEGPRSLGDRTSSPSVLEVIAPRDSSAPSPPRPVLSLQPIEPLAAEDVSDAPSSRRLGQRMGSQVSVPPTRVATSQAPRRRPWLVATVALCVTGGFVAWRAGLHAAIVRQTTMLRGGHAPEVAGSEPSAPPGVAATIAQATAASATPTDTAEASPVASATEPRAADLAACTARLLPAHALDSGAALDRVCQDSDPRRAAELIKGEIVRTGTGRVTDAMREWALLGWYEMAAAAVARAACCAGDVTFALPPPFGECAPLSGELESLARSVRGQGDPESALENYTAAVHCAVKSGAGAASYSYGGAPRGGEETAFRRVLSRAVGHDLPPSRPPKRGKPKARAPEGAAASSEPYE